MPQGAGKADAPGLPKGSPGAFFSDLLLKSRFLFTVHSGFSDINPSLNVISIEKYIGDGEAPGILDGLKIDFLIDAIDTLSPKLSLIKYCVDRGLPFVSSMGSGAKLDATAVRISDISKSHNCPFAYVIRKRLRKMGISKGFKVVYSEELPDRAAIVECEERNKKSMTGTISYLPAVFGCACAQVAIEFFRKID